jgi:outer membrane protein
VDAFIYICILGTVIISSGLMNEACAEQETIEQAWVEAYQNNPLLEAERAKLRATDEQVAQALSHWRPAVSGNASATRAWQNSSSDNGIPASLFAKNGNNIGAEIKQPLFRGFRTLYETEAAKKQVMAGRAQLQSAEQQLLLDSGKAFLDVLRDEVLLQIDRDEETVLQKKLDEVTARAKVGDLTKTDVEQAKTRLARAEVTRLQAESTLISDRATYLRLIGNEPGSLRAPSLAFGGHKELDEVLHKAETANPSVIAADYAVEAAKAEIDLNKGGLLPEINLVGSSTNGYGQSITFPGREINTQVMVQATWQLYDGGADYSKIRAARQTATQHRMELEDARHKAHEAAQSGWQQLLTADAWIKADRAEITAAEHALAGVSTEAHVGARTTLDVLNAEQELLDAKTDLTRAQHDRDYAVLQIKMAVGELTADALKLPLEPYDPKQYYDDNAGKLVGFGDDADYVVGNKNKLAADN